MAGLLVVLLLLGPAAPALAGSCSLFRSWTTGDSLTASDLNSSFTTVGQTNMTYQCLDDYSATAAQMNLATDPNSSGSGSLATSGEGELERLRHVLKHVTGWSQWWTHYQDLNFGNRMVRQHFTTLTGFQQMFRGEAHLSSAATRFHLFSISTTEWVTGAAHPESLLLLAHVNGTTRFQVDIGGNTHVGGALTVHSAGSATHAAIFRSGQPNRGLFFPTPDSVAVTSAGEVLRVHAVGLFMGADNSFDFGNQFGSRLRHLHLAGRLNLADGVVGQPAMTFGSQSTTGFYADSGTTFTATVGGTATTRFQGDGFTLRDNSLVAWAAGDPTSVSRDVQLSRPNATALAIGMTSSNLEVVRIHTGGLMAGVDNSYDVGTVSGSRFRHLHLSGNLMVNGAIGNHTTAVAAFHAGGFMAAVNNSYDIGTVSGSQFRHAHLSGALTLSGAGSAGAGYLRLTDHGTASFAPATNALYASTIVKGWAKVNTVGGIAAGFNVLSVTDDGVGAFTLTWRTAFSGVDNYVVAATPQFDGAGSAATTLVAVVDNTGLSSSVTKITVRRVSDGAATDPNYTMVTATGLQ